MGSIKSIWLFFALLPCLFVASYCLNCVNPVLKILSSVTSSSRLNNDYGDENILLGKPKPWVGNFSWPQIKSIGIIYVELDFKNKIQLENIKMSGGDVIGFRDNMTKSEKCYVKRFALDYKTVSSGAWIKLKIPRNSKKYKKFESDDGNYNEPVGINQPITALKINIREWYNCPAVKLDLRACGVCVDLPEKSTQTLKCNSPYKNVCTYSCNQGYSKGDKTKTCNLDGSWQGDDLVCTDINECTTGQRKCHRNATCTNNVGSYTCKCYSGLAGDGKTCTDINECRDQSICPADATCTNTHRSYKCTCNGGFSGDGKTCTDNNECLNRNICGNGRTCENIPGSYRCLDIDECTTGQHKCHRYATCTNNVGSYTCKCYSGVAGDGKTCTDINECTTGQRKCHRNATCTNNVGSYTCKCYSGLAGDGKTCTDINECRDQSICHADATCTNTYTSYKCTCNSGFSRDGKTCTDIDECTTGQFKCHAHAKCFNTDGSYMCTCNSGFSGNGKACNDINECSKQNCHKYANCNNTVGSFTCTCREGFRGDGKNCQGDEAFIKDNSQSKTVRFGVKLELQCTAEGRPLPTIEWTVRHFGKTIVEKVTRLAKHDATTAEIKSTLTIQNVTLNDEGVYTCIASNNDSSADKKINITIDGKPKPPEISVVVNSTFMIVSWTKPNIGASEITAYIVSYKTRGKKIDKQVDSTMRITQLDGLIPDTKYTVSVSAVNIQGASEPAVFNAVTLASRPPQITKPEKGSSSDTSVRITIPMVSGHSIFIQVIVGKLQSSRKKRETPEVPEKLNNYETALKLGDKYYIAAELKNEERDFDVGDGEKYRGYQNAKLESGKTYEIHLRGVSYNSEKVANNGTLSKVLKVATKERIVGNGSGSDTVGIAVGLTVLALVILVLVIVGMLYYRSRHPKTLEIDPETGKKKRRKRPFNSELLPLNKKGSGLGKRKSATVEDGSPDPNHPPVTTAAFAKHVAKLHKSDDRGFMIQYNTLETSQTYPSEMAQITENKDKNRYANIIAYDVSRVQLRRIDDDDSSDYINASRVDGHNSPNAYIATQGPLPHTFDDFWRMVWEKNCSSIVMLTNLQERHKLKCHKYWPEDSETYGDIVVTATRREQYADYVIRSFHVKMNETEEEREIKQFHFTVWPDHGVPEYPTAILAFQRRVRAYSTRESGPLVVHCSAGVGRSGTFIVIDSMLSRIQSEKSIDIYNYVRYLRTRRMFMVQTEEQYVFCHDALLESVLCGNTQMAAHNLRIEINKLREKDPSTKITGFEAEFKTLNKFSPSLPKECFVVASYPDNHCKNRYHNILASDHGRVTLDAIDENDDTTYINAVFVDGYKQQNAFILTQAPLTGTIKDFWRMLYEKRSACVLLLCDLTDEEGDFPQFWPEDGTEEYDLIQVELVADGAKNDTASEDQFQQDRQSDDLTERKLKLTKDEDKPLVVKMFQLFSWKETSVPSDISGMVSLIQRIEKWQQHSGNEPITVVCNDGLGRSGTFAALCSVIERVKTEQVVDVLQTIKALRIQRPGLVKDVDQYKFIHVGVQEYLDSFSDYANFK